MKVNSINSTYYAQNYQKHLLNRKYKDYNEQLLQKNCSDVAFKGSFKKALIYTSGAVASILTASAMPALTSTLLLMLYGDNKDSGKDSSNSGGNITNNPQDKYGNYDYDNGRR